MHPIRGPSLWKRIAFTDRPMGWNINIWIHIDLDEDYTDSAVSIGVTYHYMVVADYDEVGTTVANPI